VEKGNGMTIKVRTLDATFGACISDVDLEALSDAAWQEIEAAFHEHALLIFPAQELSDAGQLSFAKRFGDIEVMTENTPTLTLTNRSPSGELLAGDDDRTQFTRGNEGWHTDSSYMPRTAKASVVSARVVPSSGGQTQWADARAAYDVLDDRTREQITGLAAYHSYFYSQAKIGHDVAVGSEYGFFDGQRPLHPLVKVHSATGRPALYIGRHVWKVPGLEQREMDDLLDRLTTLTCSAPRTVSHQWQGGDVVVWDNRCLLHRAQPYDDAEPRVLMHTRVRGDVAFETALNYQ
jgi:alpha-ketoglutarate-dependent taurine dioxygenase